MSEGESLCGDIEGWRDDEDAAKEAVGGGNGKSVVSKGMGGLDGGRSLSAGLKRKQGWGMQGLFWCCILRPSGLSSAARDCCGRRQRSRPLRGLECFYQNCFQFSYTSVV